MLARSVAVIMSQALPRAGPEFRHLEQRHVGHAGPDFRAIASGFSQPGLILGQTRWIADEHVLR